MGNAWGQGEGRNLFNKAVIGGNLAFGMGRWAMAQGGWLGSRAWMGVWGMPRGMPALGNCSRNALGNACLRKWLEKCLEKCHGKWLGEWRREEGHGRRA